MCVLVDSGVLNLVFDCLYAYLLCVSCFLIVFKILLYAYKYVHVAICGDD